MPIIQSLASSKAKIKTISSQPFVQHILYSPKKFDLEFIEQVDQCLSQKKKGGKHWFLIHGAKQSQALTDLGSCFDIHPLVLEDIGTISQRPKIEEYKEYLFIVLKQIYFDPQKKQLSLYQISLLQNNKQLVTFLEQEDHPFTKVQDLLQDNTNQLRHKNIDYILYMILDEIVDGYFLAIHSLEEEIDKLETKIYSANKQELITSIHLLKQMIRLMYRHISPLREVFHNLIHIHTDHISDHSQVYLRDVLDHVLQALDTLDSFEQRLSNLQELQLSLMSMKMNEVMKVLTVIATIFIPITFITSFYGMNFKSLPGLTDPNGIIYILILMIISCLGLIYFFKQKDWL